MPPAMRRRKSELIFAKTGPNRPLGRNLKASPARRGSDWRFIRSFRDLCQFGKEWSDIMQRMPQTPEKYGSAAHLPITRDLLRGPR
jgi:hypothetical protein